MHFVRQYIGETWDLDVDEVPEKEHMEIRAQRHEEDDKYAETFEAFRADVGDLSHSMNFAPYVVHRPPEPRVPRASASSQAPDSEDSQGPENDA